MPPLEDVLRLVELRTLTTNIVAYRERRAQLSEAILEQGVEDWLDELVAEMAAREGEK